MPTRGLLPVAVGVSERRLHGAKIGAANVSSGSDPAGQLGHQQSFSPNVGPSSIERLLAVGQPPLVGMAFEWQLNVDAAARTAASE